MSANTETLNHVSDISLYSNAFGFLRLPLDFTPYDSKADVVITGVPFDMATSGRPGCRYGAQAMRTASVNLAWEHCRFPWKFDVRERLNITDCGDVVFPSGDAAAFCQILQEHILKLAQKGKVPLTLGGDHFITLPVLRAIAQVHGPVALLHFDAHSDTYDQGSAADHGTMFYHATHGENLVQSAHTVQVGIRTEYDENFGFTVLDGSLCNDLTGVEIAQRIKEVIGDCPVYLSFDIDCLDPAYAPGTGTPVAGGLTTDKVLKILRNLCELNLVGMDVVEVSPPYDHSDITSIAGATLALEMLYMLAQHRALQK